MMLLLFVVIVIVALALDLRYGDTSCEVATPAHSE